MEIVCRSFFNKAVLEIGTQKRKYDFTAFQFRLFSGSQKFISTFNDKLNKTTKIYNTPDKLKFLFLRVHFRSWNKSLNDF